MLKPSEEKFVGRTITHVRIDLERGGKVKEKGVHNYSVIAENHYFYAIDDLHLSALQKVNEKHASRDVAEHVRIGVNRDTTMEKYFGFLTIRVYSFKTLAQIEKMINKELAAYIERELGFYGSWRDVTISLSAEAAP